MDNVTFQEILQIDGTTTTYAIIDRGNGEFTSMLRSTYDEQQKSATLSAQQVAPNAQLAAQKEGSL